VVANSITDINFYFNGVLQPVVNTDGGATNTSILHTTYPAYLGCQITPTAEHDFTGRIDEIRLWNVSRSLTDLRDKMCEKLTGLESGLIGNWRFDDDYISTSVIDYSVSGIDGSMVGSALKVTSGAPIGDVSTLIYTTDYSGVSLNLNSPGGDKMKITKIGFAPHGVHLYRVDEYPYFSSGLLATPPFYYGVFPANNVSEAKYTLTYTYSYSNGVVNAGNETEATIFKRTDNSFEDWVFLPAPLDTMTNRISKKNYLNRGEFIFSIDTANSNGGTLNFEGLLSKDSHALQVFPNPSCCEINCVGLSQGVMYYVTDLTGKILYSAIADNEKTQLIDIDIFPVGTYLIVQKVNNELHFVRFVKV